MSDEQHKLKLKIEPAVAHAQKVYDEAESGSVKASCLLLLLAEEASLLADKKALEQVREKDLLQQRVVTPAAARCCSKSFSLTCSRAFLSAN